MLKEAAVLRPILAACFLLNFLVLANVALAQDFSADVIENKRGNQAPGKLYATKGKVRWEVPDPRMGSIALILDQRQGKSVVILQDKRMYMDSMPWTTRTPLIAKFWSVDDVNDACPQWKKVAEQLKADEKSDDNWGSCSRVGSDTVNGRSAVKYEGVSKTGEKEYYWVDTKLKCVIKGGSGSGSIELRNIQEASQPSSLFEVPAGYTKVDMNTLMQQRQ
jgi:hypothetical protein